jgi:hypothetical protein
LKKQILLLVLLLCTLLLAGCTTVNPINTAVITEQPGVVTILPEAVDNSEPEPKGEATLWFRYLDEPLLAPEYRMINQVSSQSYELALLTELVAGPSTRRAELSGLFPEGTRVLSTVTQGRTLFVTFSRELLGQLSDEPLDWQEYDKWRVEMPLRRRLAMQTIAATVTENCNVDQVQILISSDAATGVERLKQNYYLDDSVDEVLAMPLMRDETLLLTPPTVMHTVLQCWSERDWLRLYNYVAARDTETGLARPVYRSFVSGMEELPLVTDFSFAGGDVSPDGGSVVYTVHVATAEGTKPARERNGMVIRLTRENGLWKITYPQLTGWVEE